MWWSRLMRILFKCFGIFDLNLGIFSCLWNPYVKDWNDLGNDYYGLYIHIYFWKRKTSTCLEIGECETSWKWIPFCYICSINIRSASKCLVHVAGVMASTTKISHSSLQFSFFYKIFCSFLHLLLLLLFLMIMMMMFCIVYIQLWSSEWALNIKLFFPLSLSSLLRNWWT